MGRMKEVYMQVMHANDGIPEQMTIEDIVHMQELKIYEWQDYEREREKQRLQQYQSDNSGEIKKVEQVRQKFKREYNKD
jgi:hypothetical protein